MDVLAPVILIVTILFIGRACPSRAPGQVPRHALARPEYVMAITQLAQTTLRSVIGKMELDRTFEEHEMINAAVSDP